MVRDNTLYNRLGVSSDATDTEIKKAFIGLSQKWHPDKHPEEKKEDATEKFKEIQEAKEILLDKNRRQVYDKVGMDIFKNQAQNDTSFNPFGNGFPFANGFPFPNGFPFSNGFPENPFQQETRPSDIFANMKVTIKQIYNQENVSFTYEYFKECVSCNGKGGSVNTCNGCDGKGKKVDIIRIGMMIQQMISDCPSCNGKGETIVNNCEKCKGSTREIFKNTIGIPLSSTLKSGDQVKMFNQGNHVKNQVSDLLVQINIEKDPIFTLHNNDLLVNVKLTLIEALFGFKKTIPHINNSLTIMSDQKTQYNDLRCISNKGINQDGNLYLLFTFDLPDIDKENKEIISEIFEIQINESVSESVSENMTNISKELAKNLTIMKIF
jgi:DnaJ-class molecular chaperone